MATFDTRTVDPAAIRASANRLLALVANGPNALGAVANLEFGKAVAIWSLPEEAIPQLEVPFEKIAVSNDRWFHVVRDADTRAVLGSIVSAKNEDGAPEAVSANALGEEAQGFVAAVEFIRREEPSDEYLARYLLVPALHLRAIWLAPQSSNSSQRALFVVCGIAPTVELQSQRYYSEPEFRRALARSNPIVGLAPPR